MADPHEMNMWCDTCGFEATYYGANAETVVDEDGWTLHPDDDAPMCQRCALEFYEGDPDFSTKMVLAALEGRW